MCSIAPTRTYLFSVKMFVSLSSFNASFLDSSKLAGSINYHNWKIRVTSHLKKERVWNVVCHLGVSLLQLSSLTIRQPVNVAPAVSAAIIEERVVNDENTRVTAPGSVALQPSVAVT